MLTHAHIAASCFLGSFCYSLSPTLSFFLTHLLYLLQSIFQQDVYKNQHFICTFKGVCVSERKTRVVVITCMLENKKKIDTRIFVYTLECPSIQLYELYNGRFLKVPTLYGCIIRTYSSIAHLSFFNQNFCDVTTYYDCRRY